MITKHLINNAKLDCEKYSVKMGSGQSHFTEKQLEYYHKVFIRIMPVLYVSQFYVLYKNDNNYHFFQ